MDIYPAHCTADARLESTRLIRPIAAMLPVVVAFVLQWTFWPDVFPSAWFIFYPVVFFSSWIGGLRAGLLATALSTVLIWCFFLPERSWEVARSDTSSRPQFL